MIDRTRVKELRAAAPEVESIGAGKPWPWEWQVVMDMAAHETDAQFLLLEPKFDRAYRRLQVWASKLKQNPHARDSGSGMEAFFGDPVFARMLESIILAFRNNRHFNPADNNAEPDAHKQEIGRKLRRLRSETAGYKS